MDLRHLIFIPWIVLGLVWLVGMRRVSRAVKRESLGDRLAYAVPLGLGAALIFSVDVHTVPVLEQRILPLALTWPGFILSCLGVAFAIWARVTLGRHWSGTITLKEGHELIQSGPYALARHPIYTGFVFGLLGSAIVNGSVRGLLGWALATGSFIYKLSNEERLMAQSFGEQHAQYRARVKRLVPFVW